MIYTPVNGELLYLHFIVIGYTLSIKNNPCFYMGIKVGTTINVVDYEQ